jgi:hypothetical protein
VSDRLGAGPGEIARNAEHLRVTAMPLAGVELVRYIRFWAVSALRAVFWGGLLQRTLPGMTGTIVMHR